MIDGEMILNHHDRRMLIVLDHRELERLIGGDSVSFPLHNIDGLEGSRGPVFKVALEIGEEYRKQFLERVDMYVIDMLSASFNSRLEINIFEPLEEADGSQEKEESYEEHDYLDPKEYD